MTFKKRNLKIPAFFLPLLPTAIFLLLISCIGSATAQSETPSKIKVAVVKPINKNNVNDFFVGLVKNNLEEFISYSSEYKAFTREAVDNILKEQAFQQSGMVNDEQRKKIGALGGVDMLCISEVSQFGQGAEVYMTVNAKLIDVETGEVGEVKNAYFKLDMDALPSHIRALAGKLTGTVIDDNSGAVTHKTQNGNSASGQNQTFTVGGVSFTMIFVKGGSFTMGCTSEQSGCGDDEKPAHQATLDSYYLGEFEVTQALWQAVMGTNIYEQKSRAGASSTYGVGNNYPMYYINYGECEEFCGKLNNLLRDQLPAGYRFRIPTEAQWEYAARGGEKAKSTVYAGSDYVGEVAWYTDNSGGGTKEVGLKEPNELGIYDMSGNVWEWCYDWYSSSYYASSPSTNPKNMASGSRRVSRGGSWNYRAECCRVAFRDFSSPGRRYDNVGYRLASVQ